MIRTNIQSDGMPSFKAFFTNPLALAVFSVAATTLLASFLESRPLTPLEVFLWRPLLVFAATLAVSVVWSLMDRKKSSDVWPRVLAWVPLACLAGLLVDLVGHWPQTVISSPLTGVEALKYLATLGLAVTGGGPDAFLRGLAWLLAVAVGVETYRERRDLVLSLIYAAVGWFVASVVWALPSISLWIASGMDYFGVTLDTSRLFLEFSRLTLGSYWINSQLLRWFTGFGDQLSISYALFAASWVWVMAAALWYLVQARVWRAAWDWSRLLSEAPFLVLAAAAGLTAGWSRGGFEWLNVGAWAVWIGVFSLFASKQVFFADGAPTGFWLIVFLGAAVLGWPVLAAALILVAVQYVYSNPQILGANDKIAWLVRVLYWLAAAVLAFAFVRQGVDAKPEVVRLLVGYLFLLAPVALAQSGWPQNRPHEWHLAGWLAAAGLASLVFWTFAPLAAVTLGSVVYYLALRPKQNWAKFLPWLAYLMAWILLISLVWVPRLLNPKLVPMT